MTVLDSGFQAVETGFRIFVSRTCIPNSNRWWDLDSCCCIPDSIAQDSGFHKQKFVGFQILQAQISRIPLHGRMRAH